MFTTSNAGKETKAQLNQNADDMRDGAWKTKKDARDTVDAVKSDLRGVAGMAHDLGAQTREFVDNASSQISHATETVTTQIKQNPIPSTLIALGAGFILGSLFRR